MLRVARRITSERAISCVSVISGECETSLDWSSDEIFEVSTRLSMTHLVREH